jgi:carboxymethylenebutenolidase
MQKLDLGLAVRDSIDALGALRELPEVAGGQAGVLGFCLGGTPAFQVAIEDDPDVAVWYYGSGIVGALERADQISCPASRPDMECHIPEDAGHAFDNHEAPMFHQPQAAARAWEITKDFPARTLPP